MNDVVPVVEPFPMMESYVQNGNPSLAWSYAWMNTKWTFDPSLLITTGPASPPLIVALDAEPDVLLQVIFSSGDGRLQAEEDDQLKFESPPEHEDTSAGNTYAICTKTCDSTRVRFMCIVRELCRGLPQLQDRSLVRSFSTRRLFYQKVS